MQLARSDDMEHYLVAPDPAKAGLTRHVVGTDHTGAEIALSVVEERPLTIFLNRQEIVTAMTIADYPEYLALGFLKNQGMLAHDDVVTGVDYDDELETVVVRTQTVTNHEEKLAKKTRTSGCAVGTVFGDMMEGLEGLELAQTSVRTSWLYSLAAKINRTPSLYLEAGAIHGTILCQEDRPLVYMEDVGRHNAVDKIAGLDAARRRNCRRQDPLYDRAFNLRNGDQNGDDGHTCSGVAFGLYRLGCRDCTASWTDLDWADAWATFHVSKWQGTPYLGR